MTSHLSASFLDWDGTHIGDITEDVVFDNDDVVNEETDTDVITKSRHTPHGETAKYKDIKILVMTFKNKFPLIVDEVKKAVYGYVSPMKYHQCTIDGKEHVISTNFDCEMTLRDYHSHPHHSPDNKFFIDEVRRIFAFRSAFFLSFSNDLSVNVIPLYPGIFVPEHKRNFATPISKIETKYSIKTSIMTKGAMVNGVKTDVRNGIYAQKNRGDIPKYILDRYFDGDVEMLEEEINKIRKGMTSTDLKFKMFDIINKFEKGQYVEWVNKVYDSWFV